MRGRNRHPILPFGAPLERPDVQRNATGEWSLLDDAGFAACILDRRLRYRRINAAWRTFLQGDTFRFGRQSATWRNREMLEDLPEERRARWAQALQDIVSGQRGHFVDRTIETYALGEREIVATAGPTIGADGQIDGVLCVRYDLTDARAAAANEERLVHVLMATRRLQHFLGNQLALTLGYVELLTFDPRLPVELRDRMDEALRGVLGATETLSLLRLVTRLEMEHDDPSLHEYLGPTDPP